MEVEGGKTLLSSCEEKGDASPAKKGRAPAKFGKYVIACTVTATVSSTLLGYDMGIISGALLFVAQDLKLSIFQQEVLVGSLSLISMVGGAAAGWLSDAIGRKRTMAVASAIFFAGALMMGFAPSYAILMVGRVISGVAVGFALMIAPVYSAELSPAAVRGSLVSMTEIFINFGILLGYVVSFAFQSLPTHLSWRLMLGFGAIPSVVLAAGVLVLPESPRWLVTQGRPEEANKILLKTCNGDKEEVKLRLSEIMETSGLDGILNAGMDTVRPDELARFKEAASKVKQGEGVWKELLFAKGALRRMLIAAFGVHFFAQACGIDATVYYSPVVFHEAGIHSKMGLLGATVLVGVIKFSFIFVAFYLLDRVGRRPLLLVSGCGMMLCLLTVAVAFICTGQNSASGDSIVAVNVHKTASVGKAGAGITIAAICAYVAFFSVGFGPVGWVFASEVFPLRVRAQAVGAVIVLNRTVGGTIALTFLSMSKAITPAGVMFLFAGLAACSMAFVYGVVPETKGRSLEELTRSLEDTSNNK
eukprot:c32885_g1_i1 orf=19-1611(+)